MVKIFLQHKIFEYCINLIFEYIKQNFFDIHKRKAKVGDVFREIRWYFSNSWRVPPKPPIIQTYHNCKIIKTEKGKFFGETVDYFEFTSDEEPKRLLALTSEVELIR